MIEVVILGEPTPKQSVRSRVVKSKSVKNYVHHYQSNKIKDKEKSIAEVVSLQVGDDFKPYDCCLRADVEYIFSLPKSATKEEREAINNGYMVYKTTKPDVTDNLNKGLFDALEGVLYTNDSRISVICASKYYGLQPKTILILTPIYKIIGG